MAQRAIVVIGAGIIGCLTAVELAARDRDAAITIIDRDCAGTGASRRSAGLHLPRGATPKVRQMSARSHAYYADLKRRQPSLPITAVRATVVATTVLTGTGLAETGLAETGPAETGLLGRGYLDLAAPRPAAAQALSGIAMGPGQAAWQISGCHHTDVAGLCNKISQRLRTRAVIAEGAEVTGLAAGRGCVTVRAGTGERIVADQVVLAPGPWLAAPAWAELIAPLGLRVKKIVALHVGPPPGPADRLMVFDDEDAFLLPLPARGHWLFSYTCTEWDVEPDRLTAGLSAANVAAASDCLRRYRPALARECGSGRVFCDAYSPDGEPVVRALDDAGRIVFAGAANGSGYRLAPAIAADAAGLVTTGLATTGLVTPERSEGATGDH